MTEMNMDRLLLSLVTLLCVSCSHPDRRFEEAVLRTVQPGDNVTLYCDVKDEQKIIWYRRCSHENQPPWEISSYKITLSPVPRYHFILNSSSNSFDLRIENITESDLGIFYCSTKFTKIETRGGIVYSEDTFKFGNVTISLQLADSTSNSTAICSADPNPVQKWILVTGVTAACVLVSVLLSAFSYWLGKREGLKKSKFKERQARISASGNREEGEAEQLKYITLQNRKEQRFSRTMAAQNDDFVTYSQIY